MRKYRFVHKSDGWHTQVKHFGLWWRVDNVGPFGFSGANISSEWAKECLIANILYAGLRMRPRLREQRRLKKENARSPIAFRCLPSNARGLRAGAVEPESTERRVAGSDNTDLMGPVLEAK